MTYASVYLVGAAIAALLALLIVLNRVVLEPLARVTRHAVAMGEGSDLGARLNLQSRDEIGRLAREFDGMVARVEQSRHQLVDQSFHAGFAELAKGVLHNLGNAMTPLAVRVSKLGERLRSRAGGRFDAWLPRSSRIGGQRRRSARGISRRSCTSVAARCPCMSRNRGTISR